MRPRRGFSIIEALVASLILSLTLAGGATLLINARAIQDENTAFERAAQVARDRLDMVRERPIETVAIRQEAWEALDPDERAQWAAAGRGQFFLTSAEAAGVAGGSTILMNAAGILDPVSVTSISGRTYRVLQYVTCIPDDPLTTGQVRPDCIDNATDRPLARRVRIAVASGASGPLAQVTAVMTEGQLREDGAPGPLSAAGEDAGAPVAAMAPGGGVIAWRAPALGDGQVMLSTRMPGGPWSAPAAISSTPGAVADIAVAQGPGGDYAAAWSRDGRIVVALGDPSGITGAPITVAEPDDGREVRVAVFDTGEALVAWREGAGEQARVRFAISTDGAFPSITTLAGEAPGAPVVCANGDDQVLLARPTSEGLALVQRTVDASVLTHDIAGGGAADLSCAADGDAMAVAFRQGSDLKLLRREPSGSWPTAVTQAQADATDPQVALAGAQVHLAYRVVRDGSTWVAARSALATGAIGDEQLLSDAGEDAGAPVISGSSAGVVTIAFTRAGRVITRRLAAGTWQEPVAISAGTGSAAPALAGSSSGQALAAWRREIAGDQRIEASLIAPGGLGTWLPLARPNLSSPASLTLEQSGRTDIIATWPQVTGASGYRLVSPGVSPRASVGTGGIIHDPAFATSRAGSPVRACVAAVRGSLASATRCTRVIARPQMIDAQMTPLGAQVEFTPAAAPSGISTLLIERRRGAGEWESLGTGAQSPYLDPDGLCDDLYRVVAFADGFDTPQLRAEAIEGTDKATANPVITGGTSC